LKWLSAAPDEIVECIKSSIKLAREAKEKKMSARKEGFSQKRYLSPNC
jgi:hypothetical protein